MSKIDLSCINHNHHQCKNEDVLCQFVAGHVQEQVQCSWNRLQYMKVRKPNAKGMIDQGKQTWQCQQSVHVVVRQDLDNVTSHGQESRRSNWPHKGHLSSASLAYVALQNSFWKPFTVFSRRIFFWESSNLENWRSSGDINRLLLNTFTMWTLTWSKVIPANLDLSSNMAVQKCAPWSAGAEQGTDMVVHFIRHAEAQGEGCGRNVLVDVQHVFVPVLFQCGNKAQPIAILHPMWKTPWILQFHTSCWPRAFMKRQGLDKTLELKIWCWGRIERSRTSASQVAVLGKIRFLCFPEFCNPHHGDSTIKTHAMNELLNWTNDEKTRMEVVLSTVFIGSNSEISLQAPPHRKCFIVLVSSLFCGRDSPGYLAAYADEQFFDSALSAKGQA